jgi:hypothetical protein
MTPDEASAILAGRPTVPVAEASLDRIKELYAICLDHGIAAAMIRPRRRDGG